MENNFMQMAYTIGPIFKEIIDCVQLYFTNCWKKTLDGGPYICWESPTKYFFSLDLVLLEIYDLGVWSMTSSLISHYITY